jgi:hypothetical protein
VTALLKDLGHLPTPPVTAPPPVASAPFTPTLPAASGGAALDDARARAKIADLERECAPVLSGIDNLVPGAFDHYSRARLDILGGSDPAGEKVKKYEPLVTELKNLSTRNTSAKTQCGRLEDEIDNRLLPRLQTLNVRQYNAVRNISTDIHNLTGTSYTDKLPQFTAVRGQVQRLISQEEAALAARPGISNQAATDVTALSTDQIKNLSTEDLVGYMAKLTCHRVTTRTPGGDKQLPPPRSMQALVKLYGSMKMDPDFLDADKAKRDEVLKNLTGKGGPGQHDFMADRATWHDKDINEKFTVLKDFQDMQCKALDITVPPMELSGDLDSSGHCSGKQVQVSTKPEHALSFDEMIDTVDHETTHAYQNDMTDKLESGHPDAVGPGDPEYSQVLLFLLNNKAYAGPPDRLNDPPTRPSDPSGQARYETDMRRWNTAKQKYDVDRAAYENEPVEAHAWKAGSEAARALNKEAEALRLASAASTATTVPAASTGAPPSADPSATPTTSGSGATPGPSTAQPRPATGRSTAVPPPSSGPSTAQPTRATGQSTAQPPPTSGPGTAQPPPPSGSTASVASTTVLPASGRPPPPRRQSPPRPTQQGASASPGASSGPAPTGTPSDPPVTTAAGGRTTTRTPSSTPSGTPVGTPSGTPTGSPATGQSGGPGTTSGTGQPPPQPAQPTSTGPAPTSSAGGSPAPAKTEAERFEESRTAVDRLLDQVNSYNKSMYSRHLNNFNDINKNNYSNKLELMERIRDDLQRELTAGIANKAAFVRVHDEVKRLIEARAGGFTDESYKNLSKSFLDIANRAISGGVTYKWKLDNMQTLRATWT